MSKEKFNFILNHIYTDGKYFYKFVKVTPKGFNLLNTYTGKCTLYPHIYDRYWIGVEAIPEDQEAFTIALDPFHAMERCNFLRGLVPKARLENVRRAGHDYSRDTNKWQA